MKDLDSLYGSAENLKKRLESEPGSEQDDDDEVDYIKDPYAKKKTALMAH